MTSIVGAGRNFLQESFGCRFVAIVDFQAVISQLPAKSLTIAFEHFFMEPFRIPPLGRKLVDAPEPESPSPPRSQDIADRKGEALRVVKRLSGIIDEHRRASKSLGITLGQSDIRAVSGALRDHARGGAGLPVPGSRDEIHSHVLDRLFEELVEEPSNILYTTQTGPDSIRYESMDVGFWMECLDLLDAQP
jgi:hypothetical protein